MYRGESNPMLCMALEERLSAKKKHGKKATSTIACGHPQYLVAQESLDHHELEEERNWVTYAWLYYSNISHRRNGFLLVLLLLVANLCDARENLMKV